MFPESIKNLINCYKKLPGVGEKSAERFALASLNLDDPIIELFSNSLVDVKRRVKRCRKCNHLSDDDLCMICKDQTRNSSLICVVEEPKNVVLFEKVGSFHGLYHVLDGLISPLDGINPEDLKISSLMKRVEEENIEEIIIAVRPSVEGETTALYLARMLEQTNVRVSKIAHGVPLGADMEYMDSLTLEMALEDRKEVSSNKS